MFNSKSLDKEKAKSTFVSSVFQTLQNLINDMVVCASLYLTEELRRNNYKITKTCVKT